MQRTSAKKPAAQIVQPILHEPTEPDAEQEMKTDPLVPVVSSRKLPSSMPRPRSMSSPWSKVPTNALFSQLMSESRVPVYNATASKPGGTSSSLGRPRVMLVAPEIDMESDFELSEDSLTDTEVMEVD